VVVVTLGEEPRLAGCLASVASQEVADLELVLVENAALGPLVASPVPLARRLRRQANPGFAASFNEALAFCRGRAVLSLNPDTRLKPHALERALRILAERREVAAVAFRLTRPDGLTLDSAGIRLGWLRRARDRGMGERAQGRYLTSGCVDAACMAAALFKREALEDVRDGAGEVLDSSFFAYKEDVDLGWRLLRRSWKVWYAPHVQATHERRWKRGLRREMPACLRRLSLQNRWRMMIKNETLAGLVLRMPALLALELGTVLYLLIKEPEVLPAYGAWPVLIRESLARRRKI